MSNPYGRPVAGRLNGIHAPIGTILGPKDVTREYVVVIADDEEGVVVGFASTTEILAVMTGAAGDPRSVTEAEMVRARGPLRA